MIQIDIADLNHRVFEHLCRGDRNMAKRFLNRFVRLMRVNLRYRMVPGLIKAEKVVMMMHIHTMISHKL